MENYRLTNLFTPHLLKRFSVTNCTNIKPSSLDPMQDADSWILPYLISCRISDTAKVNKNYRSLIDKLDITTIPKVEAVEMIWSAWKLEPSSQAIIKDELLQNEENDDSYRDRQECQTTSEINIVYWWRNSKLSIPSIAAKLNTSDYFISNAIAKYKRLVKKQIKQNIIERNAKKVAIPIEKLNKF